MKSVAVALALSMMFAVGAAAGENTPFTKEKFDALQTSGELVLVDVYASWCPTCARQQKIIASFREKHPDVPLKVLTVDFDEQKQWVKYFKAPRQSTMLLYRNGKQLWFSVAETRPEVVFENLLSAAESN
ncbi:MAG TPA: thioredoxin family protein [Thermoanaerobaculia bacterium]|nr:thioredoxin family protein [Thermoanaerobaculia bacterium]